MKKWQKFKLAAHAVGLIVKAGCGVILQRFPKSETLPRTKNWGIELF